MFLTTTEADEIEAHVAGIEARTGVQIVAAVVGKSDTYVELPWKAFALGVSAAALASVTVDALRPAWTTANTAIIQAVIVLGAGGAVALLAIFVPAFARLFLRAARAEAEVRQYAQSMCLQRQIFGTPGRTGVLVLVSLFERRIEILADTGFRDRVSARDWNAIIERMTPLLRRGRPSQALQQALTALDELLIARNICETIAGNPLADRPIQERGL
jgi:putative membrane protein